MAQFDVLVQQAIAAYKAGQNEHSRNLLLQAIEINEHHELAWLYLSAVVTSLEEQQICLENVLALNPTNERARKGLETVNRKLADQQAAHSAEAELAFPDSMPMSTPPADDHMLGMMGIESDRAPVGSSLEEADWSAESADPTAVTDEAFGDWLAAAVQQAEDLDVPIDDPPVTSVEWTREDKPAVYGSGRLVELPSAQEYDDWMQELSLNGSSSGAQSRDSIDAPARSPAGVEGTNQVDIPSPALWENAPLPFDNEASAVEDHVPFFDLPVVMDEDDWFSTEEEAPLRDGLAPIDGDKEPQAKPFSFDFDADDMPDGDELDEDDDALPRDSTEPAASVGPATPPARSSNAAAVDYLALIPAGIETQTGLSRRGLVLLMVIVLLLVLNALSFGLLIL